ARVIGQSASGPPTPPASVPLTFFAAGGLGGIAFGIAMFLSASDAVVSPFLPRVLGAAHFGVLAFLTVTVLGALHQFAPVAAGHRLRSVPAARITACLFVPAVWVLALAFGAGRPGLVAPAGLIAFAGLCLAAWNLSGPLSARGGGVPVIGLRWAVGLLLATASMGVLFAFDLEKGWFTLYPRVVAAHAHLGLIGWLGVAYIAVAEKLWPMFLLSHRKSDASGKWAVFLTPAGALTLTTGLLSGVATVTALGGGLVAMGLGAHLTSLASVIRNRRRSLELLHAFVLASATFLLVAAALAIAAAFTHDAMRLRLISAEVMALICWLTLALIGHAHKVVPFISWTALRTLGALPTGGKPVLFGHLYDGRVARVTFGLAVGGAVLSVSGLVALHGAIMGAGGLALAAATLIAMVNLALRPISFYRHRPSVNEGSPA
ncbi:MAG: hypothetical protein ABI571_08290, partial [Actinomycetota bacterium]